MQGVRTPHLWSHLVSRRQFVRRTAGAAGLVASPGRWMLSLSAQAGGTMPKPIPHGRKMPFGYIHHNPPTSGGKIAEIVDPSQITDFRGEVGICRVFGQGTGVTSSTGRALLYPFAADMGFMRGEYVGEDGQTHTGTFAFI